VAISIANPPDLVLTDIMMPGLDGFGVLRELRASDRTRHVPVILLSARAGEEAAVGGLEQGADDYLAKPFAARELLARVRTHLDLAKLRREWAAEHERTAELARSEAEGRRLNAELEQRVTERTAQLEAANKELEAFSYSVSHDLRAPLRAVDGFSQAVQEDYGAQLPEEGRRYLQTIREGAQRMGVLIDDLLTFSRLNRQPVNEQPVNTAKLVNDVIEELNPRQRGRQVEIRIGELPPCRGDAALLKQAWINLLSNAFKYSSTRNPAVIEIGCKLEQGENVYSCAITAQASICSMHTSSSAYFNACTVRTNLKARASASPSCSGSFTAMGGRIRVEAAPDRGATFYFTLKGEPKL